VTCRARVRRGQQRVRCTADLDAWLRIPSISADPAHAPGRTGPAPSGWRPAFPPGTGVPTVEIWDNRGRARPCSPSGPAARAGRAPPCSSTGTTTSSRSTRWRSGSPPARVEPTIRGEELFARRGAGRRQGSAAVPPASGLRRRTWARDRPGHPGGDAALSSSRGRGGVPASPHFADLLRGAEGPGLASDVTVVTDTGRVRPRLSPTTTGRHARAWSGCHKEIDFHGPDVDLHSGSFGRLRSPNPP